MTQKLLKKLWLRVIVTVMTTAFTGSVWAQTTYALQQVTSVEAGGLYVFEQDGYVMNNKCTNSALQTTDTYETTGLTGEETYVWTLESATDGYYMKNVNGTGNFPYLNNTSSTGVSFGNNANSVWAFNFQDDNTVLIQNTTNSNRFLGYTNSTSYAYKAYAIANLNGSYPHAIKVYQLVEEGGSGDQALATSITISDKGITNTNIYEGTDAGRLIATVIGADGNVLEEGVVWSGDNDQVATIGAETGIVTLVGAGTVTFTASYAGVENAYKPSSKTYTMTVTNSDPNAPGTEAKPYTVAEARAAIDAGANVTGVYATGIVSKIVTAYNSTYGNISYNISVDGTEEADQLQAYRGKSYKGEKFTSENDIQVGDVVVIYGNLKKYNNTYEFEQDNQLVSLERPVVSTPYINVSETKVGVTAQATDGVIIVAYENISNVVADVFFCDADGNAASYDWITASINDIDNVVYVFDANTSAESRTAYMKVHALDDNANDVYSELITFTQDGYVAPVGDFATLPFAFNEGSAAIEKTAGLTQNGLGSDYKSAPYLKFDSADDYVVLAFNERPGKLTFDIKGNGSPWSGTFSVQTSEDGETYTDLVTYTDLASTTQSKELNNLGENVRYIKWVYTEKTAGNVALGNIALDKYSEVVATPTITIAQDKVNAPATNENGLCVAQLDITYNDIVVENYQSFTVQFYDADGAEQEMPKWIVAEVIENPEDSFGVCCAIIDNDGAERTTYFKVFGYDADGNKVYSNLVTVTQEKYVEPAVPGNWVETALADITPSDLFVIVCDNGNTFALANDNGASSAPAAVEVTVAENTLSGDIPSNILWKLSIGEEGYTFYPSGDAKSWLYCTNSNNGVRVGTNENNVFTVSTEGYLYNTATSRYVGVYNSQDWRCYQSINVNITDQTFKFYKKVEDGTTETATVGAAGYATYVTKSNVAFPAGVAFIAAVDGDRVVLTEVAAAPKGTAVILKGEGTYELEPAGEKFDDVNANELKASDGTVQGDGTIFVLAKPEGKKIGFYAVERGTTVAKGKAYLEVSNAAGVKAFYFDDDDATGIEMADSQSSMLNAPIYNMAGQRLQKMQKGINIVNGKKILR